MERSDTVDRQGGNREEVRGREEAVEVLTRYCSAKVAKGSKEAVKSTRGI